MRTRFIELRGVEYAITPGGMQVVGCAALVAGVAEAAVSALSETTPEELAGRSERTRGHTWRQFSVFHRATTSSQCQ